MIDVRAPLGPDGSVTITGWDGIATGTDTPEGPPPPLWSRSMEADRDRDTVPRRPVSTSDVLRRAGDRGALLAPAKRCWSTGSAAPCTDRDDRRPVVVERASRSALASGSGRSTRTPIKQPGHPLSWPPCTQTRVPLLLADERPRLRDRDDDGGVRSLHPLWSRRLGVSAFLLFNLMTMNTPTWLVRPLGDLSRADGAAARLPRRQASIVRSIRRATLAWRRFDAVARRSRAAREERRLLVPVLLCGRGVGGRAAVGRASIAVGLRVRGGARCRAASR